MFHQSGGFSRSSSYLRGKKQRTRLLRLILTFVWFFLALGFLGYLGITTARVAGTSMLPSFKEGDRLLVTPYPYGLRFGLSETRYLTMQKPQRGDLVLARPAWAAEVPRWFAGLDTALRIVSFQRLRLESLLGAGQGDEWILRRVVGLPGDTLYLDKGWCFVKPVAASAFRREDEVAETGYSLLLPEAGTQWSRSFPGPSSLPPVLLKEGEYFLLADNRMVLDDSRLWGAVPDAAVIGRVLLRYWPL
jgi:signal peptidase I